MNNYNTIIKNLDRFRTKTKYYAIIKGLLIWLALMISVLFVLVIAEALFTLGTKVRFNINLLAFTILLLSLIPFLFWPIINLLFRRNYPDVIAIALTVGNYYPQIGDRLANALQVFTKQHTNPERYSKELITESLDKIAVLTEGKEFANNVDSSRIRKTARLTTIIFSMTVFVLLSFWSPSLQF